MVWINNKHINKPAGKGMWGGAMCNCDRCVGDRMGGGEPQEAIVCRTPEDVAENFGVEERGLNPSEAVFGFVAWLTYTV